MAQGTGSPGIDDLASPLGGEDLTDDCGRNRRPLEPGDHLLPFDAEASVVLMGSIINDPAENLAGYGGTKPYVVWIGTAVTTQ